MSAQININQVLQSVINSLTTSSRINNSVVAVAADPVRQMEDRHALWSAIYARVLSGIDPRTGRGVSLNEPSYLGGLSNALVEPLGPSSGKSDLIAALTLLRGFAANFIFESGRAANTDTEPLTDALTDYVKDGNKNNFLDVISGFLENRESDLPAANPPEELRMALETLKRLIKENKDPRDLRRSVAKEFQRRFQEMGGGWSRVPLDLVYLSKIVFPLAEIKIKTAILDQSGYSKNLFSKEQFEASQRLPEPFKPQPITVIPAYREK